MEASDKSQQVKDDKSTCDIRMCISVYGVVVAVPAARVTRPLPMPT